MVGEQLCQFQKQLFYFSKAARHSYIFHDFERLDRRIEDMERVKDEYDRLQNIKTKVQL